MIILATHALFLDNKDVYGPAHAVSAFLNKTHRDHIFIKHRVEGICLSRIEYYVGGKFQRVDDIGTQKNLPFILRYLLELFISLNIIIGIPKKSLLFIGADPLNVLAGNIGKLLGKVDKTVFLSADFSLKRFSTSVMSNIYLIFDKAAMINSNQTWSVSRRIVEYRKNQGLKTEKNKILPNAPFFDDIQRLDYKEINKHDLVLVSALRKGIAPFTLFIDAAVELQKTIKDLRLLIIGSGSEEAMLKEYVHKNHAEAYIKFYGALSHKDMFTVLVKSAIGIAIYEESDKKHFRYFSDSMRTRDYLAAGLPVFFSGPSGIGSEIVEKDAGRVIHLEKEALINSLQEVLTNSVLYQKLRRNALSLAKEYDTFALLTQYFALLHV